MTSTAPYSSALSVLCAPSSARLEQITTGIGCWAMIFCRNVSPSMRGISISRVITSGVCSRIRSAATKGSAAVPMTSISGSLESTSLRVWRTTAESSTIRTRILGVLINSVCSILILSPALPFRGGIIYASTRHIAQYPSAQPAEQHFTGPGVEPNVQARSASQTRRDHLKTLGTHDFDRRFTIQSADGGFRRRRSPTSSTSAPPNSLTCTSLRIAPSSSNCRARSRMEKST